MSVMKNFFVVSAHREENVDSDKNFLKLVDVLNTVSNHYDLPIIVSTHLARKADRPHGGKISSQRTATQTAWLQGL